ncbi:Gfo/Idh/MocA family protein [Panacagrimonas sp.]|uniref:Gfo/Idh/MocA family protein n=1 Tax=Panacagrimonas sp. TaxID=2480088 RepID=UPI003B52CFDA
MRIAIIGCGYVADFYMATLINHPQLELLGVHDRSDVRAKAFADFHRVKQIYPTLDAVLADERVQLVVNLTNPSSHYAVSRAALEAGRHVYSEKPLAMRLDEAEALVRLAESRQLQINSAPCSLLSETAQTLWKALRENRIGTPRLIYAELDDGNVPQRDYWNWASASGAPWPAKDEFEVGCTLEHAGYYLTWLTAFFGPASRITSFAKILQPDKGIELAVQTPDFATACIEFLSGPVARFTCSLYAPHDHRLRIFGDRGSLSTSHVWDYGAAVRITTRNRFTGRAEKYPTLAALAGLGPRTVPLVRKRNFKYRTGGANPMDFCRGIAETAAAAREDRASRLSARWSLHVNELVLAMQDPTSYGSPRDIASRFEPLEPMPWA